MNLTGKQKNYLRGLAHSLNPIVTIGAKGLTQTVLAEIELALDHHELVKIKLPSNAKAEKVALMASISSTVNAEPVQLIGRVGVVYRAAEKPKLVVPTIQPLALDPSSFQLICQRDRNEPNFKL